MYLNLKLTLAFQVQILCIKPKYVIYNKCGVSQKIVKTTK